MSQLSLDIVTPAGVKYAGEIKSVTAPGEDGQFQILTSHANMLAKLGIGEVFIELGDKERFMSTGGGLLEIKDNKISVMVESAEWAEDIDLSRAEAAKDRAEHRLHEEKDESIDISRARLALARALNRIHVASRL
jgi:F-type H+-transporting ATPase subunit epsilon